METVQGSKPMPNPLELLSSSELLAFYGMMERAQSRLQNVAFISGWKHEEWYGTKTDLDGLAFEAYYKLWYKLNARKTRRTWFYMMPNRAQWEARESGVLD